MKYFYRGRFGGKLHFTIRNCAHYCEIWGVFCFLWRHLRFLFGSELCLIYIVHIVGLIFVCSEILPSRNLALVFCPGLMSFGFRWMPLLLFQDIFPELLQVCIWKDHVQSLLGRTSVLGSIHATFFVQTWFLIVYKQKAFCSCQHWFNFYYFFGIIFVVFFGQFSCNAFLLGVHFATIILERHVNHCGPCVRQVKLSRSWGFSPNGVIIFFATPFGVLDSAAIVRQC